MAIIDVKLDLPEEVLEFLQLEADAAKLPLAEVISEILTDYFGDFLEDDEEDDF